MPTQLSFEHHFSYSLFSTGITLSVVLSSSDMMIRTKANVDTGAEFCVFTYDVGIGLGLDIESGIPMEMGPAGGGVVETFGHEVNLQTLDVSFDSIISISSKPKFPSQQSTANDPIRCAARFVC